MMSCLWAFCSLSHQILRNESQHAFVSALPPWCIYAIHNTENVMNDSEAYKSLTAAWCVCIYESLIDVGKSLNGPFMNQMWARHSVNTHRLQLAVLCKYGLKKSSHQWLFSGSNTSNHSTNHQQCRRQNTKDMKGVPTFRNSQVWNQETKGNFGLLCLRKALSTRYPVCNSP